MGCEPSQAMKNMMSQADLTMMGWQTTAQKESDWEVKYEKELQHDAEKWLSEHGFLGRGDSLTTKQPNLGWWIHLHKTRKNPIILDLLVMSLSGRCIEIELKTKTGTVTDEQAFIISCGGSVALCRSMPEFIEVMDAFINERCKAE